MHNLPCMFSTTNSLQTNDSQIQSDLLTLIGSSVSSMVKWVIHRIKMSARRKNRNAHECLIAEISMAGWPIGKGLVLSHERWKGYSAISAQLQKQSTRLYPPNNMEAFSNAQEDLKNNSFSSHSHSYIDKCMVITPVCKHLLCLTHAPNKNILITIKRYSRIHKGNLTQCTCITILFCR